MSEQQKQTSQTPELDIIEGRQEPGQGVDVELGGKDGGEGNRTTETKKPNDEEPHGKTAQRPEPDGVESLRAQLAAARLREAEKARRVEELERRNREFETASVETKTSILDAGIREAGLQKEAAKRAFQEAAAQQNAEGMADAQDKMADAAARLLRLQEGKSELQRQSGQPRTEGRVEARDAQQQPVHDNPIERVAAQMPAKSAAWIRQHPECITDAGMYDRMIRSHHVAVDQGLEPESPEYFGFIEQRLGYRAATQPNDPEPRREARQEPEKRPQSYAAPARGGHDATGSRNGNGRRTVTLTPEQRAVADAMEIPYDKYAASMLALEDEGRINKRTH